MGVTKFKGPGDWRDGNFMFFRDPQLVAWPAGLGPVWFLKQLVCVLRAPPCEVFFNG